MGHALMMVVAGGIITTGTLWHFNHFFTAVCVGCAACAAVRWIWQNYA